MVEQDGKQGLEPPVSAVPQDAGPSSQSFERFNLIGHLVWALILVWVGGVLLADNLGYLKRMVLPPVDFPWSMSLRPAVWRLLFLGVGALLTFGVVARLLLPRYREDVLGNLILVIVCLALGFGYVDLIWPLILIALGIALLVRRGSF